MAQEKIPVGKRFSHIYLEKGKPREITPRFRKRVDSYFSQEIDRTHGIKIGMMLEKEIGLSLIGYGTMSAYFAHDKLFIQADVSDVLDSITLIWKFLNSTMSRYASDWINFVSRVMIEENIGYRLDSSGGVHPFIDEEFEKNSLSALRCLNANKFNGVKDAYEDSHRRLEDNPPDTKAAIRSVFEANEILYKLMFPKSSRLTSSNVRNLLKPAIDTVYADDNTARETAQKNIDGFCDWVDACHNYRHGQGEEEPVNPPMDIAILTISVGASFLRWLVDVDDKLHGSQ